MPRKIPKLNVDQLLSLELLHIEVIAAIEEDAFTYEQCYSWYASCVLWLCVAARLRRGVGAMQAQAGLAELMLREYHKGKLELDTEAIDMLKYGVVVMAELAKLTSLQVASESADVAEVKVNSFLKELDEQRKDHHKQSSG